MMKLLRPILWVGGLCLLFIFDLYVSEPLFVSCIRLANPVLAEPVKFDGADAVPVAIIALISVSWLALSCLLAKMLLFSAKFFGVLGAVYMPVFTFYVFAPPVMAEAFDTGWWRFVTECGPGWMLLLMWTQTVFGAIAVVMVRRKH